MNRLPETRQRSLQESDLPEKRSHSPLHAICFSLVLLIPAYLHAAPQLDSDIDVSSEGYFVLNWDAAAEGADLRLQQSSDPDFNNDDIEEWSIDGASQFTQSGLMNGQYYFRLVDSGGVSNTVTVQVMHHSLMRATLFFALGAVLFIALLMALALGRRATLQGEKR